MISLSITKATHPSVLDNRYCIYCHDPYRYEPVNIAVIQKLVEELGAVNPTVVEIDNNHRVGGTSIYLLADNFTNIKVELNEAFRVTCDFMFEGQDASGCISYLARVDSNFFNSGYPKLFWEEEDLELDEEDFWGEIAYHKAPEYITPSKETLQLIEWIKTEYSVDRWLDKTVKELQEMTFELFYSGLNSRSISDTLNDILLIVVEDRIDWQHILQWLDQKKKEGETIQLVVDWVKCNFESAGSGYFMSSNPTDFNHYTLGMVLDSYNLLHDCKMSKDNDQLNQELYSLSK
jgi:hypothetical protein